MSKHWYQFGIAPVLMLTFCGAVNARSALEFLRAEASNKESAVMKEIVILLVSKGYKNVPDWPRLSSVTKAKILEKGYRTEELEAIAEEAALGAGMRR